MSAAGPPNFQGNPMAKITITGSMDVYVTEHGSTKLHDLLGTTPRNGSELLQGLTFLAGGGAYYSGGGWVRVGSTEVTLVMEGRDELVAHADRWADSKPTGDHAPAR